MLKNYLKIAFRNLKKYKLYSLINIIGLAVGIACCILIMLFVKDEWTYDSFHSNADNIYRAWTWESYEGRTFYNTVTPYVLAPTLDENIPEVEHITRIDGMRELVKQGEFVSEELMQFIEPDFFSIFDFSLKYGKVENVLNDPYKAILTPDMATKYFGVDDPMGQTLSIRIGNEYKDFTVSGVIEKAPSNSSIQYTILLPFSLKKQLTNPRRMQSWFNITPETYVTLKAGTDPASLESKLDDMMKTALGEDYEPGAYKVGFQPILDIHLNTEMPAGAAPVSDPAYSYILAGIALLILIVACINFMTLAVGGSMSRSREVGIRKVVGARRKQLMLQFWSEAIIISTIATILGVFLADICLPFFNQLAGKELILNLGLLSVGLLILLALVVGFISGSYPAAVLSGFAPSLTIKGNSSLGRNKNFVLKSLVAFQFSLSILLIVSTFIMQQQLRFLQNTNLGFDQEQIVVVPYNAAPAPGFGLMQIIDDGKQKGEILRQNLLKSPDIKDFASANHSFGSSGWVSVGYTQKEDGAFRSFFHNGVDYDYISLFDLEILKGRNFSRDNGTDARTGVIVNEAFLKEFEYENAIGEFMPGVFKEFQIIGVVKDFHFASLHTAIEPIVLSLNPMGIYRACEDINFNDSPTPKYFIKLQSDNLQQTIAKVETAWEEVLPGQPFNFTFMDETIQRQYEQEQRLGKILTTAALLAIFIACLGLFGIVALSVAKRTKEIGIRKVLGASVPDIVVLINRDFLLLVGLAMMLAFPIAYFLMNTWLQDFEYRISIGWVSFALAAVISILLAVVTISLQAFKAAQADPIESLRYE